MAIKIPTVSKFLYFFELETGGQVIGLSYAALIVFAWFQVGGFNGLIAACGMAYVSLDVVRGSQNVSMKNVLLKVSDHNVSCRGITAKCTLFCCTLFTS